MHKSTHVGSTYTRNNLTVITSRYKNVIHKTHSESSQFFGKSTLSLAKIKS